MKDRKRVLSNVVSAIAAQEGGITACHLVLIINGKMGMEKFKDIEGYEGLYRISSWGRVYNIKRDKFVSPEMTKKGYIACKNGGVFDCSYPTSKLRRGRVQEGETFHQH